MSSAAVIPFPESGAGAPPIRDLEAELNILSSVMLAPDLAAGVQLDPGDFYDPAHQELYRAMRELVSEVGSDGDLFRLMLSRYQDRADMREVLHNLHEGLPAVGQVIHFADRVRRARVARDLEELSSALRADARAGDPAEVIGRYAQRLELLGGAVAPSSVAVRVWEMPEPEPLRWAWSGLMPIGFPSLLFAHGGSGKSFLALGLALHVVSGRSFLAREVVRGPVLYLDAELDKDEFLRRAYRVARGMGLDRIPEGLHYFRLPGPLTSSGVYSSVVRALSESGVVLSIIDSFAAASATSNQIDPAEVLPFFERVARLGTVLLVDHIAKPLAAASGPAATPYGSVFKHNLARSCLRLDTGDEGALRIVQTKSNFGRLQEPMGVAVEYHFDRVQFSRIDASDYRFAKLTAKSLPAVERVHQELAQFGEDGAGFERVAEGLTMAPKTVQNHISTLKRDGRARQVSPGVWAVVEGGECA